LFPPDVIGEGEDGKKKRRQGRGIDLHSEIKNT